MPSPSELSSQPRRRGLGDNPPKAPIKPGYCPDIDPTDAHPCAPPQIFSSSNTELWTQSWPAPAQEYHEHHDFFPEWEHPPQKQQQQHLQHPIPLKSHQTGHGGGTSHAELTRLSTRDYSLRAADPSDFASVWEHSILPLLSNLIKQHCTGDFAVDVHNFPERSAEAVPRVIYITLPADMDTAALEPAVRLELRHAVPERFNPVYLKFRKGDLQRSQWWYVYDLSRSFIPLAMLLSFSRLLVSVAMLRVCPQTGARPSHKLRDSSMHGDRDITDLSTSQGRRRDDG